MSALITITGGEMLAMGSIVAVAVVGYQRPELAPATGLVGGAAAGWLKQHMLGFCIFKSDDVCRRERNAAMISGALIGAGVGVVRRGFERAQ